MLYMNFHKHQTCLTHYRHYNFYTKHYYSPASICTSELYKEGTIKLWLYCIVLAAISKQKGCTLCTVYYTLTLQLYKLIFIQLRKFAHYIKGYVINVCAFINEIIPMPQVTFWKPLSQRSFHKLTWMKKINNATTKYQCLEQ